MQGNSTAFIYSMASFGVYRCSPCTAQPCGGALSALALCTCPLASCYDVLQDRSKACGSGALHWPMLNSWVPARYYAGLSRGHLPPSAPDQSTGSQRVPARDYMGHAAHGFQHRSSALKCCLVRPGVLHRRPCKMTQFNCR